MKVAVVGSRGLQVDISRYIPPEATLIITGGARGIDALAQAYAERKGIPAQVFYPDTKTLGKYAYLARNDQIVDAADYIVAIWDGTSKGTRYTIARALKQGKEIKIYTIKP